MGRDPQRTVEEIEQTRVDLALKVDELVGRARVEATQLGKKAVIATAVLGGILALGWLAKRRVGS